ncbi:hypothetical protein HY948_01580 [Candidatus Gottesmanbacteria bacterium]|nr:hypothetical protein [Candidatus Gottesmanbacteria bacterium]
MTEYIDEAVSVVLYSNHVSHQVVPIALYWLGKRRQIDIVGLHTTVWEGRNLIHEFSVTAESTSFRLRFHTETLQWKLLEVADHE